MTAYKVVDAKREYDQQPYRDLWSSWKLADAKGRVDAPFVRRAVQEREDPQRIGVWALFRDTLRRVRVQMYLPRGGHWKCIRCKLASGFESSFRKTDWKMVTAIIALATFLVHVISKL